jgi:hypothetical protein
MQRKDWPSEVGGRTGSSLAKMLAFELPFCGTTHGTNLLTLPVSNSEQALKAFFSIQKYQYFKWL